MVQYAEASLALQVGRYLLRLVGLSVAGFALTYWIVGLALAVLNLLLLPDLLDVTTRTPFYPPDWPVVISFVLFCAYLVWQGIRQLLKRRVVHAPS
jgi:hypothetical protein